MNNYMNNYMKDTKTEQLTQELRVLYTKRTPQNSAELDKKYEDRFMAAIMAADRKGHKVIACDDFEDR